MSRREVGLLSLLTPHVWYRPPVEPYSGVARSNKTSRSVQSHFRMESTALHFSHTDSQPIHTSTRPADKFAGTRSTIPMRSESDLPTNDDCGSTCADQLRELGKSEPDVRRLSSELDTLDATWKRKVAETKSSEVQTMQTSQKSSVKKTATSFSRESSCAVEAESRNSRKSIPKIQRRRPRT